MRSRLSIPALVLILAAAGAGVARAGTRTDRYDAVFRKYARRYFGPTFDWHLFKAQAMAESDLDPSAKSWVGARGLMQLMPSTFREIRSRNPELVRIDDPESNIAAGIYHDRQLWRSWAARSEPAHRERFMLSSYNAGLGTLERAQQIARDRDLNAKVWPSIEQVAPAVPRWRYEETFTYIDRIRESLAELGRDRPLN
jgi:membrane-bound lytic murein transglycosylase MltF